MLDLALVQKPTTFCYIANIVNLGFRIFEEAPPKVSYHQCIEKR